MQSSYKKEVISNSAFYIVAFTKNVIWPYLIFIHGGPGFNCGSVEYLIENDALFESLQYNLILYDQRACGRSLKFEKKVTHEDNVNDLYQIYEFLVERELNIGGFMGHSYGAKLLFDFYNIFKLTMPGVFVSTARSIITPRLNNILLDLAYLKTENQEKYQEIIMNMDNFDLKEMWSLTEALAPLFQKNKDRPYLYWANLVCFKRIQKIQNDINLPVNNQIFMEVRKDLYSDKANFSVEIDNLNIPALWINGVHDYIMDGAKEVFSNNPKITHFYKSAHYPHLEENERFCEVVNDFLGNHL